jgi:DNA (cytosine-5)-methyltransferase 1
MGINWMSKAEINEAIPPAYTEFVGKQLMKHLAEAGNEQARQVA